MTIVSDLLDRLLNTSEPEDIRKVVLELVSIAKTDMNKVVEDAITRIKTNNFDGSKWSTLAFSILDNLDWPEKAGEILRALVDHEENPAYFNNLGIFLQKRGQFGKAIEYYTRAYAIDYQYRGHEKASNLPAWKNLYSLVLKLASLKKSSK